MLILKWSGRGKRERNIRQKINGVAKKQKQVNTPAASGTAATTKSEGETLSTPDQVVKNWIAERNKSRDKISSIDYHRQWTPADAGDAIYQGRRSMKDGNVVLLLKRGDEVLVKNASKAVVTKAATKWKVGQIVKTDARGRFIEKPKLKVLKFNNEPCLALRHITP